ncbi:helix-turn-helix transcriptional regulator [Methylobacter svalbardensis]|uniref:helix-turn-helix transcriptional regulator n=1 Tax=Methylobacter svalbardensis TaxID=3080016 RepID=UPI0030EEBF64
MDKILSLNEWLPYDAKIELAKAAKGARLKRGWKRDTLSEKTGIPVSTLKRYETTGEISLDQFLRLTFVLGDLDRLKGVFDSDEQVFSSLDEMVTVKPEVKRKRGTL